MASTQAVGASVAIVQGRQIVYLRAFGKRSVAGPPTDTGTKFEIGSLTKQFTAAAILQLQERAKLSLDDRVAKYLPAFPHASQITLRELLNQTSGLPDFVETNHFLKISQQAQGSFAKIERMAAGPLHFAPGSQWEYSNTNYVVLGRVVEIVSGMRYRDYVRLHLFAPAGMHDSTFLAAEPHLSNVARGYWRGMTGKGPLSPAPAMSESWTSAAGDVVSTAGDIARWDVALQSGRIISPSAYALMTHPATLAGGKTDDYGFHWWTDPYRGRRLLSGLGDTYGESSCNDVFPADHLDVVVLENIAVTPDGRSDAAAGIAQTIFDALVPP